MNYSAAESCVLPIPIILASGHHQHLYAH